MSQGGAGDFNKASKGGAETTSRRIPPGHASSLAVWIESKSPSVGGRKIRRGVTIGIKWRIERLSWNCRGPGEDENAHCLHAVLRPRTTQRSVFGFAGSKLSVLLVSRFLPASKVCLWCGSQHRPKHFNEGTYTVVTHCDRDLRDRFPLCQHLKGSKQPRLLSPTAK